MAGDTKERRAEIVNQKMITLVSDRWVLAVRATGRSGFCFTRSIHRPSHFLVLTLQPGDLDTDEFRVTMGHLHVGDKVYDIVVNQMLDRINAQRVQQLGCLDTHLPLDRFRKKRMGVLSSMQLHESVIAAR